ncbi:hypothetical protein [Candidatus Amarolinea dominans]|uniref:hypothetical protein n=1 Tax=Candidatus Amarolinea dominans TaxID=3140696 RepID=UPI0031373C44|nr:hypothetical protein [Anaerolineae bacterium]
MIYLIHGDEEFLRAEALAEIKTALGPPEFAQLNTAELDGALFRGRTCTTRATPCHFWRRAAWSSSTAR